MLRDTLAALLRSLVEGLGYELWELEYGAGRGSGFLRLYILTTRRASRSTIASG